jgi:hypothetical protein
LAAIDQMHVPAPAVQENGSTFMPWLLRRNEVVQDVTPDSAGGTAGLKVDESGRTRGRTGQDAVIPRNQGSSPPRQR